MATKKATQLRKSDQDSRLPQWREMIDLYSFAIWRAASSRLFMGVLVAFACVLYLWNTPHAIDYPLFDEATYYGRAYALLHGNIAQSEIAFPGTSPVYILYYALWITALHTSLVYPWVYCSSLFLVGIGAYLLLSRLLHPLLSFILASATLVFATPVAPSNACFYFGTGLLWISLSLVGSRVELRGLALLGVLLSALVRPEFTAVLLALGLCLAWYEWRRWRRRQYEQTDALEWRMIATSYAPALLGFVFVGFLILTMPSLGYDRVSSAIPWSYTDWYARINSPEFHGWFSYDHIWILFDQDFAPVSSHTLTGTLIAMLHNPAKLASYIGFEAGMLIASFYSALMHSFTWRYGQSDAYDTSIVLTAQNTWQFVLWVTGFAAVAVLCGVMARRRDGAPSARFIRLPRAGTPQWLAFVSLSSVTVWLLLVLSYLRFFEIYPVVLLLVGIGITQIIKALKPSVLLVPLLIISALVAMPHPYLGTVTHPMTAELEFVHSHIPSGSTFVALASDTYVEYLQSDGVQLHAMEAGTYASPLLINAVESNPALEYALVTGSDGPAQFEQWAQNWSARYPVLSWSLVAAQTDPPAYLYALPPNSGSREAYLGLLQQQMQQSASEKLPNYNSVDFNSSIVWHGSDPRNHVAPIYTPAWGITANALVMYPDLPGAWVTTPHTVTTTLPESWSGQTLIFAGAFAPWEVNKPQADGTQLVFTIPGTAYHQVVQLPNTANQSWRPILLRLPRYTGSVRLQVTVLPRYSLLWDDTLLSFLGVAATPPPVSVPADGTGH